jgi:5-hydroxyisourate hydrolase-like protein (transthyretin family)
MKQEEVLGKVTENVNLTFDQMDTLRREGLQDINTFQQVKRSGLKKEKARLTDKLGPEHQKVAAVQAKIRDIDNMEKDLDALITEANIAVEPVDENTWKVHGKVFDKNRKGIQGLTAALYDKDGKWQREIGYGCTHEQGYFSITYSTGENVRQKVSTDKELLLYILDKNHNILYKDQEPLFVHPGHIDYRAIYIADAGEVCTSPEPDQDKPGPGQEQKQKQEQEQKQEQKQKPTEQKQTTTTPEKDQWIVEGKIKDEKNKPGKGIKVNLYDTEHRFDDRLGSKVTDKSGKFKFTFTGEDFQALKEAEADILLEVVDDKGKTLYTTPRAVRCRPGGVENFDIQLPGKTK